MIPEPAPVCPACGATGDAIVPSLRIARIPGHSKMRQFAGHRCTACDHGWPVKPPREKKEPAR